MQLKNFTKHALLRMQQRGKNKDSVKMVLRYGTARSNSHSVGEVLLQRKQAEKQIARRQIWLKRMEKSKANKHIIKAMRRRMQILERMRGCSVIQKDGTIITVYNRTRRRKK